MNKFVKTFLLLSIMLLIIFGTGLYLGAWLLSQPNDMLNIAGLICFITSFATFVLWVYSLTKFLKKQ